MQRIGKSNLIFKDRQLLQILLLDNLTLEAREYESKEDFDLGCSINFIDCTLFSYLGLRFR